MPTNLQQMAETLGIALCTAQDLCFPSTKLSGAKFLVAHMSGNRRYGSSSIAYSIHKIS